MFSKIAFVARLLLRPVKLIAAAILNVLAIWQSEVKREPLLPCGIRS